MHTKRIIPCLDVNAGRVVKGVNFVNLIDAGDPVEIAKAYDKAGADEVVFLDITASSFAAFTEDADKIESACIEKLCGDVSWFCKKFDYRYKDEPWNDSKDAVERAIKFLS